MVTDARSGTAHLIADEAMATGQSIGRYVAVCGDEVLAASLSTPERSYCRRWRAGR